jgi:uncharacterized protein (TIGR03382 family)
LDVREAEMRRSVRVVVGAVVLSSALAWPCSGPVCEDMFRAVPMYPTYIPANAPAVGVQTALFSERNWDGGSSSMASQLVSASLHFPDGGSMLVPTSVRPEGVFFSPPGGFIPTDLGSDGGPMDLTDAGPNRMLRLQWVTQSGAGSPCVGEQSFGILPAAPLPTVSAQLYFTQFRIESFSPGNLCGGPVGTVQYADVYPALDSQMEPWRALTRWELEVDGVNWSATNFGSTGSYRPVEAMHSITNFHVQCVDGGPSGDATLQPGMHQARLLAYIAGLNTPIPSNTLTINFDCVSDTSVLPDGGLRGDGGIDAGSLPGVDAGNIIESDAGIDAGSADAGTDAGRPQSVADAGVVDAGSPDGGVGNMDEDPPSCGCQTTSLGWPVLLGLLMVGLGARRRRDALSR